MKVSQTEKSLDALARLLTGDETCAAIFLDSENRLWIASNRWEPRYAHRYLTLLADFINGRCRNKDLLTDEAFRQINNAIKKYQAREAKM